jgi:hypothetical protein
MGLLHEKKPTMKTLAALTMRAIPTISLIIIVLKSTVILGILFERFCTLNGIQVSMVSEFQVATTT